MTNRRTGSLRPHAAARVEARLHMVLDRWLRARGWRPGVTPYVGYGADGWVRVLARVAGAGRPASRQRVLDKGSAREPVLGMAALSSVTVES